MSAEFLKMAPATRRFFEVVAESDWPTLFGLRVEYDRWMPDGLVGIVGQERRFDPDRPDAWLRETRWIDLRPKGN